MSEWRDVTAIRPKLRAAGMLGLLALLDQAPQLPDDACPCPRRTTGGPVTGRRVPDEGWANEEQVPPPDTALLAPWERPDAR